MLRRVALAAGEELEPVPESREQRDGWQQLRPRGGQLDRERQALEACADLGDGARVPLAQREARIGGLCAGDEELGRLVVGERWHGELAFRGDVQRCAARHDHLQPRRSSEQARDAPCCRQHLLEVVDEEEQLAPLQLCDQDFFRILAQLGNRECIQDRPGDQLGLAESRKRRHG